MSVDISKIKPGDEVTVRMRVTDVGKRLTVIFSEGSCRSEFFLRADEVVTHTPKALSVGDRVNVNAESGEIVSIAGEYVWVRLDGFDYPSTWALSSLERA